MSEPNPRKTACPSLECPECREPLVPAETRGRTDSDGNFIDHGLTCRCRWCDWRWWDDGVTVYACPCGAKSRVDCDDDVARLREIGEP